MRLKIEFEPASGSALLNGEFPRHFQAAIYSALDDELAHFVHEQGFVVGKRAMRMMVFSDVVFKERPRRAQNGLRFHGPAAIVVASPIPAIVNSFATSLLKKGRFRVGDEWFDVTRLDVEDPKIDAEYIEVRSLSPIVAYSTMFRPDGRKYTCYFQPGESDFARLVSENLSRKYVALYGRQPKEAVEVDVRRGGRMVIRTFKGTVVKGWHCTLGLRGARDLLKLALDAGLGSKNAQGWGCVEPVVVGKSR